MATITDEILTATPDPTRPMLTFYDDDTGERTELSALTLGNWAAKTANFFRDELGLSPADTILVDLPEHWQTVAILLGAWWAGIGVVLPGDSVDTPRAVVTWTGGLDSYPDAEEIVVASLDPFGLGVPELPVGVIDYGPAVRIHSDNFSPSTAVSAMLEGHFPELVLDQARTAATVAGIECGSRVLSTRVWRTAAAIIENLLAPLVVGASLVVVANADEERLAARAEVERATTMRR
ncbi:TIGR03089 family protein [Gordonia defluvii]|uniref:TIGR03089 family protein n=1 Tax=Gordonia defluvii TaxID=283718 RepID=A0ABP6LQE5_9ACTN|nr:TIGR03089 family protein [Gordonia sp. UBA5067]